MASKPNKEEKYPIFRSPYIKQNQRNLVDNLQIDKNDSSYFIRKEILGNISETESDDSSLQI